MDLPIYYDFDEFLLKYKKSFIGFECNYAEFLVRYTKVYKLILDENEDVLLGRFFDRVFTSAEDVKNLRFEANRRALLIDLKFENDPYSFGEESMEQMNNYLNALNHDIDQVSKIYKFLTHSLEEEKINIRIRNAISEQNAGSKPVESKSQNDDNYLLYALENNKKALFIFERWAELYKNKIRTRNADFTFLFYKLTRDPKTKLLKNKSNQNFKTICINNLPELNLEKMRIDGNLRKPTNREDEKRQKDFDKIISDWEDQNKEV